MAKFVGILTADFFCAEGSVTLYDDILEQDGIFLLDVIGDWIGELQTIYNQVHAAEYGPNDEDADDG